MSLIRKNRIPRKKKRKRNTTTALTSWRKNTKSRQSRVRMAIGAGNLFGVITGAVLILVLLTLIFSIVHFVINDMGRSFSLFQTKF